MSANWGHKQFRCALFKNEFRCIFAQRNCFGSKTGPKSNLTLLFDNYIFFATSLQWEVFLFDTMQPLWRGPTEFSHQEGKKVRCNEIVLGAKTGSKPHMTLLFDNYIFFASSLQWEVCSSKSLVARQSQITCFLVLQRINGGTDRRQFD